MGPHLNAFSFIIYINHETCVLFWVAFLMYMCTLNSSIALPHETHPHLRCILHGKRSFLFKVYSLWSCLKCMCALNWAILHIALPHEMHPHLRCILHDKKFISFQDLLSLELSWLEVHSSWRRFISFQDVLSLELSHVLHRPWMLVKLISCQSRRWIHC